VRCRLLSLGDEVAEREELLGRMDLGMEEERRSFVEVDERFLADARRG